MTPGPRASERARLLALTFATACAIAACRQTVILDPSAQLDAGGGGAPGAAGFDGGAGKPDSGGVAGAGGNFDAGFSFDGLRLDALGNCFGGQVQHLKVMPRYADIMFVVDRSAAMQSWFGDGTTLQVMQQQVEKLVTKYEKAAHFGYVEYPSPSGTCGGGPGAGTGCCAGTVTPPSSRSAMNVDNAIHACDGNGPGCTQNQRPLADALAKCNKTFSQLNFPSNIGKRYVVLLTGDEPTCGGPNSGEDGGVTACDTAVNEVAKLNLQDIFTAVFGVGDSATTNACLNRLAAAGTFSTNSKVYLARTPNDLSESLPPVVQTIAEDACHLDVLTPPFDPRNVSLFINNTEIDPDGVDGWEFDSGTTLKITVRGSACRMLLNDPRTVDLISGCPPSHH